MKQKKQLAAFVAVFAVFFLILLAAGINLYQINEEKRVESGDSGKIIISFNKQGLIPFDIITIEGKNLDPEAATSVMFTIYQQQALTIPALSVTATSVEVPVPPLAYNNDSGHFGIGAIQFKVIQVKKDGDKLAIKTSNEIAGIAVMMPKDPSALTKAFPDKMPKGTITRAFAVLALKRIDSLSSQAGAEDKDLKTAYAETKKGMEQLVAGLDKFIKDPNTKIQLATTGTTTVAIGKPEIAWLDAFYAGFLGLAEERQLLTAEKIHFSLIPAALAAETACESKWKSETDLTKIVNLQVDCLFNKTAADSAGKASDKSGEGAENWQNKSFRSMQHLALGFASDGLGIEKQIGFAFAGYVGPLNPVMTTLIKPKIVPAPFMLLILFNNAMVAVREQCKAYPDSCYRNNNYTVADPFNIREILFMDTGVPQSLEYRFQTPEEFNSYFVGPDNYNVAPLPVPEPIHEPPVLPEPVTVPRKVPSPRPISPDPIKYIPPAPSPTPPPVVIPPTPAPVIKNCQELKDEANTACHAGCGNQQDCYTAYSGCTPSCELPGGFLNSNCVNTCLGTLNKCTGDSAKCTTKCLYANYDYKCP